MNAITEIQEIKPAITSHTAEEMATMTTQARITRLQSDPFTEDTEQEADVFMLLDGQCSVPTDAQLQEKIVRDVRGVIINSNQTSKL